MQNSVTVQDDDGNTVAWVDLKDLIQEYNDRICVNVLILGSHGYGKDGSVYITLSGKHVNGRIPHP